MKFAKKAETETTVSKEKDTEITRAVNGIVMNIRFLIRNTKDQHRTKLLQFCASLDKVVEKLLELSGDHPTNAVLVKAMTSFEKVKRGIKLNLKTSASEPNISNLKGKKTSALQRSYSVPNDLYDTRLEDNDEEFLDAREE